MTFSTCGNGSCRADDCSVTLDSVLFTKSLNNGATVSTTAADNSLIMRSGPKTDFFNEPDGKAKYSNAPALLAEIDNTTPFTFSVKVAPRFNTTYDAGAVYVYSDDNLWQKLAFELDERANTRIVSVRTATTSDDNNHDIVTEKSVFLKISSDTKSIGFYYSTNGTVWHIARVYKNSYPSKIWIGISSQSPIGSGTDAVFQKCVLSREAVKDFRAGI